MKWFKHQVHASRDEKICELEDFGGLEAYAIYFKLLEIVAQQMDDSGDKCQLSYSLSAWAGRLNCHHHKVTKYFKKINDLGLAVISYPGVTTPSTIGGNPPSKGVGSIEVAIPKLLEYRDNHTRNLQAKNKIKNKNNPISLKRDFKDDSFFEEKKTAPPPENTEPKKNPRQEGVNRHAVMSTTSPMSDESMAKAYKAQEKFGLMLDSQKATFLKNYEQQHGVIAV